MIINGLSFHRKRKSEKVTENIKCFTTFILYILNFEMLLDVVESLS